MAVITTRTATTIRATKMSLTRRQRFLGYLFGGSMVGVGARMVWRGVWMWRKTRKG